LPITYALELSAESLHVFNHTKPQLDFYF
jgi:hypothetical protein